MSKLRRTMLYVPGNSPSMIVDAAIYGADSVMFDLEDAISTKEKDAARWLVYHALKSMEDHPCELVVRINGLDTPYGEKDIWAMVDAGIDVIRLPKTETAQDIHAVEALIKAAEEHFGVPVGKTKMMAAVESALGVLNAPEIAKASDRLIGIALGAEDYVTNLKTNRSPEGIELLYARSTILNAARAAGIAALDTVYSDVDNLEGFEDEVRHIHQLGFDGKSIINPRQVEPVHRIYMPSEEKIKQSIEIIKAVQEAEKLGIGVINVKGKMVDKPIVERAERILMLAGLEGGAY